LGNVLNDQGKSNEAIACYQRALALRPDLPEVHYNLANVLKNQGRLDDAIACYRRVLALKPDLPEAHYSLGDSLMRQGRLDDALGCFRNVLSLEPNRPEAHSNVGNVFKEQGRLDEALDCYRKALSLDPEFVEARWSIAMAQIPVVFEADADPEQYRSAFSRELEELERWFNAARVIEGFKAVGVQQPFWLAYQEENNRDLLQRYGNLCTRLMSEWFDRQTFAASPARHDFDGIIRIGIVSHHFRNHSVWSAIIKGWFEQLDRKRFSLHAFYLGVDQDRETLFAQSHALHFEQGGRGLRQWVEAILGQQLDVLIYPGIGMDPMTVKLASLRLAPVQVATWGHPETTGLPTIDCYLSAEDLEPPDAQGNYTEELVTLPHLGCFYKSPQVVAVDPDLGDLGIDPESPFLLCPGVPFKYAPQHDGVFTEIARRLGRCRFIFFTHQTRNLSEKLRRRLEIVFARSRLNLGDFVTFIPWQNWPEFYGLLKRADVFLDTIGFSGFNTAMQAVECGLPIVTREGRFLRGRLASGILKRMGLQELVAESEEEYIALAIKLVQDAEYRERIRARIEAGRPILFEDPAPIRALEDLLARISIQRRN
jgi:predicted O-linked N-acetylglucosamine transferase (SPINDLY family)